MAKADAQKMLKKLKSKPQGRKNKRKISAMSEKINPTKG